MQFHIISYHMFQTNSSLYPQSLKKTSSTMHESDNIIIAYTLLSKSSTEEMKFNTMPTHIKHV